MTRISVAELLTHAELPAPSDGALVASKVIDALDAGVVELDFTQVSGLTTSFANLLFRELFARLSTAEVQRGIRFKFKSRFQRDVIQRSLRAALSETRGAEE